MHSPLETLWTLTKAVIGALGGFAGLTKIFEWLFQGPKIVGEARQIVIGDYSDAKSGARIGTHVMVNLYTVNKRIQPITVKDIRVFAKISGQWKEGQLRTIPAGFRLPEFRIDFGSASLIERIGLNLLEYGKGVTGWLRVMFEGAPKGEMSASTTDFRFELTDAFGKTHKILYKHRAVKIGDAGYFPGSGIPAE